VIVGDGLHGLLNELVSFIFQTFPVSKLSSVDTATEVVVLGRRRWGPIRLVRICGTASNGVWDVPVGLRGDNIVDAQFLTDLFDS
jgi:hypothetical protein